MRPHFLFLIPLLLFGCGASEYSRMTEDYRQALNADELGRASFFVAYRLDFVSLKKGEIVGDDIFKREVKRTLVVETDSAGRVVASGPQWLTVEFNEGILLTFRWDPISEKYLTPGWGTITIQNERFDIKQGVLSGGYVELLVRKTR
jgi:hypothetical protein